MRSAESLGPTPLLFSVIVATYNGRSTLARALESLAKQSYPSDCFEVIVVDDGSTEDIAALVGPAVRFCRLTENQGVAAARNAGLALALGDVVVGLDDDCVADPGWLASLAQGFEHDDVVGVGGVLVDNGIRRNLAARYLAAKEAGAPPSVLSDPGGPLVRRLVSYLSVKRQSVARTGDVVQVSEIYGANSAFWVDSLRAVGGWDKTMSGMEDTDLCRRIVLSSPAARFVSIPTAAVSHEPFMTLGHLLHRAFSRGRVRLRYYRRNGFIPPFYPSPLLMVLGVFGVAFLNWAAAIVVAVLAPQLLYRWWARRAWSERTPVPLLFPYLQLAEEAAIVVGLLAGYRQKVPPAERRYSPVRSWLSRNLSRFLIRVRPDELRAQQSGETVWLTFDDYGSEEQVHRVLNTLAEHSVRAMFFLVGQWARAHPDLVEEIAQAGHVLGNHTYSHTDLLSLSEQERETEIDQGVPGALLRPPMGRYNKAIRAQAHRRGMGIAYWSVDSDDWQGVGEEFIHAKVTHEARRGSVILFHLHADNTVAVLPRLISSLRTRNLDLASTDPGQINPPEVAHTRRLLAAPRSLVQKLRSDSLVRNSAFLMASTGIMSGLGFVFWIFVARLYSPTDIGVASAVISVSVLISNVSMLGLNTSLIRFLPISATPSGDVNAALIIVGACTAAVSVGYALAGTSLSSKLPFFSHDVGHVLFFGCLLAAVALNSLTDSVFIARRRAHYHSIAYTVFGLVRLLLALILVRSGALGIFLAYTAAGTAALLVSVRYMEHGCQYHFFTRPTFGFIARTYSFSTNNYFGTLLAGLPSQVVPSLIVARLGGSAAAFFAMAMTIANLLYIVPVAIEQSLLAEGANDESRQLRNSLRAAKILFAVVVPMVVLTTIVAPYLLAIFGRQYSQQSSVLLRLLALSTIFVAITALGTSMLNVQQRSGWITVIQSLAAVITLAGVILLLSKGLMGVGLAFLGGSGFAASAHIAVQLAFPRKRAPRHSKSSKWPTVKLAGSDVQ